MYRLIMFQRPLKILFSWIFFACVIILIKGIVRLNFPLNGRVVETSRSTVQQRVPNIDGVLYNIRTNKVKSWVSENVQTFTKKQKHVFTEAHKEQERKIQPSLNGPINGPPLYIQTSVFHYTTREHIFEESTASDLVLFSAIVGNSSHNASWDRIVLQGWEAEVLENKTYICCVMYRSGHFQTFDMLNKSHWMFGGKVPMAAKQFICPSNSRLPGDIPDKVALSVSTCHKQYGLYTTAVFAYRHSKQIAVCAKVRSLRTCLQLIRVLGKLAYGDLPADDILSWFEVHKLMGVNKVLTYTYGLNKNASRVLKHYAREGIAEVVPFFLPARDRSVTYVGQKNPQSWNDEQIAAFDCHERLKGYAYLAMFDLDEYMIPTIDETWTSLFTRLWQMVPNAAGFFFDVQLHITSWEPADKSTQLKIGRYLNRTAAMQDRMKHVDIPDRLYPGGLSTHYFNPKTGFKRRFAPQKLATIHHFRPCRTEWKMCNTFARFHDDSVSRLLKKVENRLLGLKATLLV